MPSQTETINRLLKKQSSRSRAKRSALLSSVVPTPQSPHSGDEGEGGEGAAGDGAEPRGTTQRTMLGSSWRWVSRGQEYMLGVPIEWELPSAAQRDDPGRAVRRPALCDIPGCGKKRKYRLKEYKSLQLGACCARHLNELGPLVATGVIVFHGPAVRGK